MKLIKFEFPNRDIHGPLEKRRGLRSDEQIGSSGRGGKGARRMRRGEEEGCRGHEEAESMGQGKNTR